MVLFAFVLIGKLFVVCCVVGGFCFFFFHGSRLK